MSAPPIVLIWTIQSAICCRMVKDTLESYHRIIITFSTPIQWNVSNYNRNQHWTETLSNRWIHIRQCHRAIHSRLRHHRLHQSTHRVRHRCRPELHRLVSSYVIRQRKFPKLKLMKLDQNRQMVNRSIWHHQPTTTINNMHQPSISRNNCARFVAMELSVSCLVFPDTHNTG